MLNNVVGIAWATCLTYPTVHFFYLRYVFTLFYGKFIIQKLPRFLLPMRGEIPQIRLLVL